MSLTRARTLSLIILMTYHPPSLQFPALSLSKKKEEKKEKKRKNVKGSPHLDFHSRMSSMEFSRKANPSNSVKRTVWVCVFSIKKDYSITKTDPVWKASLEYTVW